MPIRKNETINGELLRSLRNLKGLKQLTVANMLGISHQAYSKIECCKNVSLKKAITILAVLNCSLEDIERIKDF